MFIMRKYGEAWDEPFIAIYEPSADAISTIKSTEYIYHNSKVVGVKVLSEVSGQEIIDVILANDNASETITLNDLNIIFTGRFAVVRTEVKTGSTDVSLYIGKGQQLNFIDQTLNGDADGKAYLEYSLNYELSTDEVNLFELISAYPNPTNGEVHIKLPTSYSIVKIEVYNIHAQLMKSIKEEVQNGKVNLNLNDYSNGIYFIKLDLEEPVYIKVIKN
jgi:hypothetical protein